MALAYIGLGSNLGDRRANLDFAIRRLKENDAIDELRCSSYYETAPVGPISQGDFLNAVVEIKTHLTPEGLWGIGQQIEQQAGRVREVRWGPRTLDFDLLDYNQIELQSDTLTLPHSEAHRRAFVLVPWAQLAPNFVLSGDTIAQWLETIDHQEIRALAED